MAYKEDRLYQLLPAIYRIRDAERGEPLKACISVIAEQASVMEDDIAGLYENWFIETCAEWVVPYIGDLLGVRNLHPVSEATFSQRARVANTLGYRRRKGTASMLEQMARDTTGWPARLVEFFQLLGTTQYANHIRIGIVRTPDLRESNVLELLDSPFDTIAHAPDIRSIARNRGKHNIPNVGIFLWRLQSYPVTQAPPFDHGAGRFSFSQLGQDMPLFNTPMTETDPTHLAEEINVPAPIRRRQLAASVSTYYGEGRSLRVTVNGAEKEIEACNLAEWMHRPESGKVAVDPVLGRIAFASGEAPDPETVRVDYYYGLSSEVGGGCYVRDVGPVSEGFSQYDVSKATPEMETIQKAIDQWTSEGKPNAVIQINDNEVYEESLNLVIPPDVRLEIRSADQKRPVVLLSSALAIQGDLPANEDQEGGQVKFDGLLVTGDRVEILDGELSALDFRHCTLVPGRGLKSDGSPSSPGLSSLAVIGGNVRLQVSLTRSICGGIDLKHADRLTLQDCLVDGTGGDAVVVPTLRIQGCTVWGSVQAGKIELAENSIFNDIISTERKQEGCVRFCFVPAGSRVPRPYRCQPDLAISEAIKDALKIKPSLPLVQQLKLKAQALSRLSPMFTDRRYGQPGYGQLHGQCPAEIKTGADDQSEMGAFHHLMQPQREANLLASLNEYLRVGLEAGIFYVT